MARQQPKLPTETDRQFFHRNLSAVGLLAFWLFVNVLLSWFFSISDAFVPSGLLVYASLGVVVSQVVVLGLLLAVFPASLLFRLMTVTAASVAVCGSLLLGAVVFDNWYFSELFVLDALPIVLISFSVPLLLARHFLHWQLHIDWMTLHVHSKLSVAGLMVSTAVVAMAVSLLNFGNDRALIIKLLVAAGCMGVSFVIFVPMTYLVMISRWKWAWLIIFTMVPFSIGMAVVLAIGNSELPFWMGVGMNTSVATLILSYGMALVVLQNCGGRLETSTVESQLKSSSTAIQQVNEGTFRERL